MNGDIDCLLFLILLTVTLLAWVRSLENGLVLTPPMGWLSWTRFLCQTNCGQHPKECISQNLFVDMANLLVSEGYRDAGYTRVNIDDCWAERRRDSYGRLQPDRKRFSHGIKWLATYPDYKKIMETCNLWRNFNDVQISWQSIVEIIDFYDLHQDMLASYHGPGHWNDPDMLIIGNKGLTVDQAKVQMAMWCLWSAPLLMSNDLRDMGEEFKSILLNKKLIAVDQDQLGIMGKRIAKKNQVNIYRKPMTPVEVDGEEISDYSYAVVFFNTDASSMVDVQVSLEELGLERISGYEIEDLFSGNNYGTVMPKKVWKFRLNPTSVVMWKATILTLSGKIPEDLKYRKGSSLNYVTQFEKCELVCLRQKGVFGLCV